MLRPKNNAPAPDVTQRRKGFSLRWPILNFLLASVVFVVIGCGALFLLAIISPTIVQFWPISTAVPPGDSSHSRDVWSQFEPLAALSGATLGLAVSFAGSIVAIVLAKRALDQSDHISNLSENQNALTNRQVQLDEIALAKDMIIDYEARHISDSARATFQLVEKIWQNSCNQFYFQDLEWFSGLEESGSLASERGAKLEAEREEMLLLFKELWKFVTAHPKSKDLITAFFGDSDRKKLINEIKHHVDHQTEFSERFETEVNKTALAKTILHLSEQEGIAPHKINRALVEWLLSLSGSRESFEDGSNADFDKYPANSFFSVLSEHSIVHENGGFNLGTLPTFNFFSDDATECIVDFRLSLILAALSLHNPFDFKKNVEQHLQKSGIEGWYAENILVGVDAQLSKLESDFWRKGDAYDLIDSLLLKDKEAILRASVSFEDHSKLQDHGDEDQYDIEHGYDGF